MIIVDCKRCCILLGMTPLCTEIKDLAVGLVFSFKYEIKSLSVFWSSQYNLAGHKITVFTGEGKVKECLWLTNNDTNFLGKYPPYVPILAGVTVHMIYLHFSLVKNS